MSVEAGAGLQVAMTRPGISAMGYYLPEETRSIEQLQAEGRIDGTPDKLRHLGFESIRVETSLDGAEMAQRAIEDLQRRSHFDIEQIDLILYGSGLSIGALVDPGDDFAWTQSRNPLPLFNFPGPKLQAALGLQVPVMGINQLACSTFHAQLELARCLLLGNPQYRNILCVTADRFPSKATREVVHNLMSDSACAAVVSRGCNDNRVLATHQETRGVYWNSEVTYDQLISAYFALIRDSLHRCLEAAELKLEDLDLIIPHNVTIQVWNLMSDILGVPKEKIFTDNIPRFGHAVSADNTINHLDALDSGRIKKGDRVAWIVVGFGSHWSTSIVEV